MSLSEFVTMNGSKTQRNGLGVDYMALAHTQTH